MTELLYYIRADETSPFEQWFDGLDSVAASKITIVLGRLEHGHRSAVKPVGEGVHEYKMNWGPGYRIYFGYDGAALIILLTGGTKKRQQKDIAMAKVFWADYKKRRPKHN